MKKTMPHLQHSGYSRAEVSGFNIEAVVAQSVKRPASKTSRQQNDGYSRAEASGPAFSIFSSSI